MLVSKEDDVNWAVDGWKTVKHARDINPRRAAKFRLYPEYDDQFAEFAAALDMAWKDGAWCVYFDEVKYMEDIGLKRDVNKFLTQGRSKRLTVVVGMQRPAQVTVYARTEPTHIVSFQVDPKDRKAIETDMSPILAREIDGLGEHKFAYFNKVTQERARGDYRQLDKIFGPLGG